MKLSHYEWDPEKDLIAEGASAEVFKAKDTNSQNRYVALKIYKEALIKGTTGSSSQKKYTLEKEFDKIDGLSHTNIISFYGLDYLQHIDALGRSSSNPIIIMEYASEGTLHDIIKTTPSQKIINNIIEDILSGVEYLHSEGVIHRDLKPGNILISKNRKGKFVAKITDFGISRDILSNEKIEQSFTEGVGTPHYMAPEQFYKKKFGLKGEISERTDMWAIGVVIYRLLTGKLPFGEGSKDYEQIRDAIVTNEPDYSIINSSYKKGLISCFQKEASKRPAGFSELKQFFQLQEKESDSIQELETILMPLDEKKVFDDLESEMETQVPTNYKEIIDAKEIEKLEPSQATKLHKRLMVILGLANIIGTFYFLFFGTKFYLIATYAISIVYLLSTAYVIFRFFKQKPILQFWQLLIYGFLLFITIVAFCGFLDLQMLYYNFENFIWGIYFAIFHFLFIVLLTVKQLQINIFIRFKNELGTSLIVAISVLMYLVSLWLPIFDDRTVANGVMFLTIDKFFLVTLLPNIFFVTAVLAFISNRHRDRFKIGIMLFLSTIITSSLLWYVLDRSYGYNVFYIQEFQIGYYLWLISIFMGFAAMIYKSIEKKSSRKYYWLFIMMTVIVWSAAFGPSLFKLLF